jgi:hypothetical protein
MNTNTTTSQDDIDQLEDKEHPGGLRRAKLDALYNNELVNPTDPESVGITEDTKTKEKPSIKDEPIINDDTEVTTDAEEKPVTAPVTEVKAPRMWAPEVREKFASLPEDVRNEVLKRETMIDKKLSETASERQIAQSFISVVEPFDSYFKEAGLNPFQAVNEMLGYGQILKKGTAQQKASLISQIIQNNGVDLTELDNALAAQLSAPKVDPAIQNRLNHLERELQQRDQMSMQHQTSTINSTIDAFANDPKNEFFEDVAGNMIAILNAGMAKDLPDAYEQACWSNENVRKAKLAKSQQNAGRVTAATASLKGNSSPRAASNAKTQPKTRMQSIQQAWKDLSEN